MLFVALSFSMLAKQFIEQEVFKRIIVYLIDYQLLLVGPLQIKHNRAMVRVHHLGENVNSVDVLL